MAEVSIREFAESVNTPVERLLVQLGEAGLPHREADEHLNDTDKEQLLAYLRRMHGKSDEPAKPGKRLTLKRKQVSELRVAPSPGSTTGRKKTVTVEVRKRRTIARKPSPGADEQTPVEAEAPTRQDSRAQRMEETKRELAEEAKRRQQALGDQLAAEQEARDREELERKEEAARAEQQAREEAEAVAREAQEAEEAKAKAEAEAAAEAVAAEAAAAAPGSVPLKMKLDHCEPLPERGRGDGRPAASADAAATERRWAAPTNRRLAR